MPVLSSSPSGLEGIEISASAKSVREYKRCS